MGAGLLQISLSGDTFDAVVPEGNSYFRTLFRKHTNYAVESLETPFERTPTFGSRNSCVIPRLGDLLGPVTLKVTLTKTDTSYPFCNKGTYYPVENLVKCVQCTIGGQVYDMHTSDYFRIYDSYHRSSEESLQYQRLANFDGATITSCNKYTETLYLPLVFAFCRSPIWYLPLLCLPSQEVKLVFDFRMAAEIGVEPDNFSASLFVDYVYLTDPERLLFLTTGHTSMYECVQQTGALVEPPSVVDTISVTVPIGFTGDMKCMYFVVKNLDAPYAAKSVVVDGVTQSITPVPHGRYFGDADGTYLCLQANQFSPNGLGLLQAISEKLAPVLSAQLTFNGTARLSRRSAVWYNRMEAFKHTQRCPMPGMYMLSFVFDPVNPTPTGCANFDQVDVELEITFKKSVDRFIYNSSFDGLQAERAASFIENCRDVQVFGLGYKVLDVQNEYAVVKTIAPTGQFYAEAPVPRAPSPFERTDLTQPFDPSPSFNRANPTPPFDRASPTMHTGPDKDVTRTDFGNAPAEGTYANNILALLVTTEQRRPQVLYALATNLVFATTERGHAIAARVVCCAHAAERLLADVAIAQIAGDLDFYGHAQLSVSHVQ